jgi:2-iminobutanoate/2-iminopropanoate deaminase
VKKSFRILWYWQGNDAGVYAWCDTPVTHVYNEPRPYYRCNSGEIMSKTIATENAPAAIGPYVQGVDLGSMIITSGQIPVDPKTGSVPEDVSAQARQSLENVKAIVEAAGLNVGDIVKTTVFVKDLNDFATVNATYEAFFTEHNATFPARSCVEVARLPKDVKIEIEAIAVRR